MNRLFITIFTLLLCQCLLSQEVNQVTKDAKGREKMLGEITKEGFTSNTFNSWFTKNHEAYTPDETIVKKLKRKLKKYTITVFMGTWCGDSKKEVPRFYKVLEAANFPESKLRVVGLNNGREQYKQGPNGEEKGMNIHRVPTFIVYNKKGKEVGRIVEHPAESLEADLLRICRGKSYEHNYQIVTELDNLFQKKGETYITENVEKVASKLKPFSKSLKELNTYGYVLLRAKATSKAIAVFTMNTKLFPDDKNGYDSLGEAYFVMKNYEKATENYSKVLALDPKDTNAKTMLAKMK
ncbi:thioredoxin family protein [Kordia sp. YSTF-M3]|uniref:Thioredoxin family protein n=1 Tax=Kordia aestuariivivens TaxID=2759037 RepID=A0ABR7Q802_9FLAO|nr:thioredoxin family protein [Kordia aestuariivivens]MBC8754459.1 thioredoxin family protein [Kordia aestuariivivens]